MEIAKQMMSRVLLAAAAAIAVAVAIIATDLTPPAAAQSEDEATGRIVARRLDDGRVEFGWQPAGCARVLPRQRYFPAGITHNRWLRSSPVEVDGAEIGRINARLLEDSRVEFAFTPTDGERIQPQARYFPADARVGRWLRSTEIAIGPPAVAPRYIAVSAGWKHTCAIRTNGEIACWGIYDYGETDAPEGSYTAVSAGEAHSCAIRESDSAIDCWGVNVFGQANAPDGSYSAVSAGNIHTCAIKKSDSELQCWGDANDGYGKAQAGSFSAIAVSRGDTCAIRESGEIACWGDNEFGQADAPDGSFTAVSAGRGHICAIRESGEIACWGSNTNYDRYDDDRAIFGVYVGQTDAPDGSFTAVSAGHWHTCAIRENGEIACWGDNEFGQADAPDGSFTAVSAGRGHTCAIRTSGKIECWGWNEEGQATPPAG